MKTKLYSILALGALILAPVSLIRADDAVSKADKEFFKNAGEMNMTEIALGRMAQTSAFSPEVKSLGATLVADHSGMNTDLIALAKQKGVDMTLEPTVTEKTMLEAFKAKSGVEFDREFREHVAKDHDKAIKTLTDAVEDSKDPDVKAFAAKNLASFQAHMQMIGGKQ
jgi:putative membrane protein